VAEILVPPIPEYAGAFDLLRMNTSYESLNEYTCSAVGIGHIPTQCPHATAFGADVQTLHGMFFLCLKQFVGCIKWTAQLRVD